jgi:phage repressor protein C with HTH and peptisase S24 domain
MRRQEQPLTHEWIWSAIDTLARRRGITASALARLAGLDPTAFNRSKRLTPEGRPRWPSTESIAKVLEATGTTLDEFATLELEDSLDIPIDEIGETEITGVPVVGSIRAAVVADWEPDLTQRMAADGSIAPGASHRRFAVSIADSSLEPAYSIGNVLVVSEAAEPRAGDRVLVKPAGMPVLPRLLVSASVRRIELGAFGHSGQRLALSRREVDWMARIVLVRQ